MKRDLELVRNILLAIEDMSANTTLAIPGLARLKCTPEEFYYHVKLLMQAGFVDGHDMSSLSSEAYYPTGLTWDGAEFLDNIRDDTVWNKTKQQAGEKLTSVSMAVISELARAVIKAALGMPL